MRLLEYLIQWFHWLCHYPPNNETYSYSDTSYYDYEGKTSRIYKQIHVKQSHSDNDFVRLQHFIQSVVSTWNRS
jgi:hypothetical protein